MKILFFIIFIVNYMFAISYTATIEPYRKYEYSASLSGIVTFVNKKLEFSYIAKNTNIVSLDTSLQEIELNHLIEIEKEQNDLNQIDKQNYQSKQNISLLSRYEKLIEKKNYLTSRQSLLATRQKISILKNQINKKIFFIKKLYLGKILVQKHSFVNAGTKLFVAYDISKLKIIIYVKKDELKNIKKAKIFINKKKSDFKVLKVSNIKDDTHISTYRVELVKQNKLKNFIFGNIVDVSFVK